MKVVRGTGVVCFLVICALIGVSAAIEKSRVRREHRRRDISKRDKVHPRHHTAKKILPDSRPQYYSDLWKSSSNTHSQWDKTQHRRHRSDLRRAGGIGWMNGDDGGSWWKGENVCTRNETRKEANRSSNGTKGGGNNTFRKTELKSETMSSRCEDTGTAYKCTNARRKNDELLTTIRVYECCPGYERNDDTPGCAKAFDVTDLISTFERLNLTMMAKQLISSTIADLDQQNYTVFAPTNDAFAKDRDVSILGHVVKGVYRTIDLEDDQLLDTQDPPMTIRINKYIADTNQMITANCVPMVIKDRASTTGIIHMVQKVLPTVRKSLDEIVSESPRLTQLSKVIKQLQLDKRGNYTLFAPTDSAFRDLKPNLKTKIFTGQQCGIEFLRQHLLPSVVCSTVVGTRAMTRNVLHHLINLVREGDDHLTANGAPLVDTDIMASNGVMHIIDRVLISKNGRDIIDVMDRPETKDFLKMITDARLTEQLQNMNNFTIFVPTNDALKVLPDDFAESLRRNPKDFVKLLNYHIVPHRISYRYLRSNGQLPTLDEHHDIFVNSYEAFPFHSIQTVQCAPVVESDTDSCENMVHVVSKVLRPPNGDMLDVLKQNRNFSSIIALVDSFKLDKLFTTNKRLTFFAPTNKAFESLSQAAAKSLRQDEKTFTRVVKSHMLDGVLCCSGISTDTFPFSEPLLDLDDEDVSLENSSRVSFNGVPVTSCDQMATNGVVHGIDQFFPQVLRKYGIVRRAKWWRRLLFGSDSFRNR